MLQKGGAREENESCMLDSQVILAAKVLMKSVVSMAESVGTLASR
jgi:hypothetical protein